MTLLMSSAFSYAMNTQQHCDDKKKTNNQLQISSDKFFTEEQKKSISPLVQSAIYTRYQIDRLIQEMKADSAKEASNGHFETLEKRGPFTIVRRVNPQQKTVVTGGHGRKIADSMQAKL